MRINMMGQFCYLFLRDQSAKTPCMDLTLITPNGLAGSWDPPEARVRRRRRCEMRGSIMHLIFSVACTEERELEYLGFNCTSLV
jgi:hypothetical protein